MSEPTFTIKGKHARRLSNRFGLRLHWRDSQPELHVRFLGWNKRGKPTRGCEAYSLDYYFDEQGNYNGPDQFGVEPAWEDA